MADLNFQYSLANSDNFRNHVLAQLISSAISILNETLNDVQTVSVSGGPTGGTFTLSSLPGVTVTKPGTLTSAANTVTGLPTTQDLFVGMSVTGTNVPANTTLATITSTTAGTLSANATGSGAQSLTFSGGGSVTVPFNCSAAQLQALLGALPGIGQANVICTGGPLPGTPIVVTFVNGEGNTPQLLMTILSNNLTGGTSPTPTVAHTTTGVAVALHDARAAQAKRWLTTNTDPGLLFRVCLGVSADATVAGQWNANGSLNGVSEATAAAAIANAVAANWNSFN